VTRYKFFGGKGGVGKTTCAAAAAVSISEAGRDVLVVSTDPAHSLGDALTHRLGPRPRRVPTRRGMLHAVELDADRALARWLGTRRRALRMIAERGTYLDHEDIDRLLELSIPGVDELIGLVELTRLVRRGGHSDVVVDTAPTGHTLRLLAMPDTMRRLATVLAHMQAKHRFLSESLGGGYRPDVGDALVDEIDAEGRTLRALLADPRRCTFAWVLRPEMLALEEARDGVAALDKAGIAVAEIVVNGVTSAPARSCAGCSARHADERRVLAAIADVFAGRPLRIVPALHPEPRGVAALRRVARELRRAATLPRRPPPRPAATRTRSSMGPPPWLDVVAPPGVRLLLVAGKGGVGKTTVAAAAALALADATPARRVLLLSTDPAHSLADVLGARVDDDERTLPGGPPNLSARELDAERALLLRRERYRESVDDLFNALTRGSRFDIVFDRTVIQELIELAPPGLDEVFGVLAVVEALSPGAGRPYDVVVVDTAPTGHALRLLALPAAALQWVHALLAILLKYRKLVGLGELASDLLAAARDLKTLTALLEDRTRTRLVPVTRAAELPRLETERLLAAVRRLGIEIGSVVINAVTEPGCVTCTRRARAERRVIDALRRSRPRARSRRSAMIFAPAVSPPPRGATALREWGQRWRQVDARTA
jgi:arsenite-transporting ATPase